MGGKYDIVECRRRGCKGTCPRRVVDATNAYGSTNGPAECRVCGQQYVCEKGAKWRQGAKGHQREPGAPNGTKEAAQIKELQLRIKQLEGQAQPPATKQQIEGQSPEHASAPSKSEADRIKEIQERIAFYRDTKPQFRDEICKQYGGYEVHLQELDKQLQEERAQQRGQKPLAEQQSSAETYLNRMQKVKEANDTKLENIQRQLEQLAKDAESQKAKCQEADAKVQKAKEEVLAIREKKTAELRGLESPSTEGAATGVANLASAVKGVVQNLPPSAAAQATQALEQLMAIVGSVGHLPPGTQEACADAAKEGRALQEQMYTEADVHKMLECAVDDMDVESDVESEAPTEGGEEAKASKKARKAEKLKAKAARKEKLKDSSWSKVKVMARISKS